MLDPKNSTQTISKGETNTRPRPIGGDFASLEEEPQSTNIEYSFSAVGKLDFQQPTQTTSSTFKPNEWVSFASNTVINTIEKTSKVASAEIKEGFGAIMDLGKMLVVSEKPKEPPKPEEKKKMEDGLVLRQALEVIENARISNAQQEKHKSDSESERILGRIISKEEANRKLNKSASFQGLSRSLSYYDLVELRKIEAEEEQQAKQAKMQQTRMQTSKGAGLSNRTDAQEGQSTTANAIATAG